MQKSQRERNREGSQGREGKTHPRSSENNLAGPMVKQNKTIVLFKLQKIKSSLEVNQRKNRCGKSRIRIVLDFLSDTIQAREE